MAYTGACMLTGDKFHIFHEYVEEIMERSVFTHEIGFLANTIKEKSKDDFIAICVEQEPRKDEVILTKEEYGELVSREFDIGYTKGYTEALEQNDALDKIKAEIEQVSFTHSFEYGEYYGEDSRQERIVNFDTVIHIIDKYKAESEVNNADSD